MEDEVMVRAYRAETQEEAAILSARDALTTTAAGWVPITRAWSPGEWPTWWIALGAVLAFSGLGIVILAMLFVFKPDGTLIVTYGRAGQLPDDA